MTEWWLCKLIPGEKPRLRPLASARAARRAFEAAFKDGQPDGALVQVQCALTGDVAARFEMRDGFGHYSYPSEGLSIHAAI